MMKASVFGRVRACVCYAGWKPQRSKQYVSFAQRHTSSKPLPLNGIKILDLSRVLAGPFCTMNLADLGADVIKVERPGIGDETRQWGPPFVGTETTYFLSINRGKRSIAVDMKSAAGFEIVWKLACQADVLVENFLPGKMEELGLGYETLVKSNPGLVYASISGYGATGPYSDRGGYDVVASAVGGLMGITGPVGEESEPCKAGVALTDLSTGLYCLGAITAALHSRNSTGYGQKIDCSLLETQVALLVNVASAYLNANKVPKRMGTAHESIVPYQAFDTMDGKGKLVVAAMNDNQFFRLCQLLDLTSLPSNSKFATNPQRVANRDELLKILNNLTKTQPTQHWLQLLEGSGLAYGPVNTMEDVFDDPQVKHQDMIMEFDHPTAGKIRIPGKPVKLKDCDKTPMRPPPLLGEHTREILLSLGYSNHEISNLLATGVIQID
eukprot:m.148299 g.148299  ORF g.148299 m.148299 type:complete len:440 (-) comp14995_c0_seq31:2272-3591(-)